MAALPKAPPLLLPGELPRAISGSQLQVEAGGLLDALLPACSRSSRRELLVAVKHGWRPSQGDLLFPECYVGRQLGRGMAGSVFELVDKEGKPLGLVLKVLHSGVLASLNGVPRTLEREWAIGRQLAAALSVGGRLPGFMHVGAALVLQHDEAPPKEGEEAGEQQGPAPIFKGMVVEQLRGRAVSKVLEENALGSRSLSYVHDCLLQVFTALKAAQEKLGLRHWDLGLSNIMEHRPLRPPRGGSRRSMAAGPGCEAVPEEAPRPGEGRGSPGPEEGPEQPPAEQGSREGGAASGSDAPREGPAEAPAEARNGSVEGHSAPGAGGTSGGKEEAEEECPPEFKIIDFGHSDLADRDLWYEPVGAQAREPLGLHSRGLPKISFQEWCYRLFWRRKGDVYRLLMSLQNVIDGRIWPAEDADHVRDLLHLVYHVTGCHLRAWLDDNTAPMGLKKGHCWEYEGGCLHGGRRWAVRLQALADAYNPGITAAEALALPFFVNYRRKARASNPHEVAASTVSHWQRQVCRSRDGAKDGAASQQEPAHDGAGK